MISSLLIANRGEIAVRIIKTAKQMGIHTVAVFSDADSESLHVSEADERIHIGPSSVNDSYLNLESIMNAATISNVDAIHPGYGFLSENYAFAQACRDSDILFVGPSPETIKVMGDKSAAKSLMQESGVPIIPGYHGDDQTHDFLYKTAEKIGFPLLIKASAGGGGKGMRIVNCLNEFSESLSGAQREADSSFGDSKVILEKYIQKPKHIEVQVFGDRDGEVVHLFERDCSVQRRYQKVIEEAPASQLQVDLKRNILSAAVKAAGSINYEGAGTVEFIIDTEAPEPDTSFYFMEMNTRLQVEHPVTEMITGYDLVEWQLRIASGENLPVSQNKITLSGHAIEVRLYAEDPINEFLPVVGNIIKLHLPDGKGIRVDTGVSQGDQITINYDPLLAKIIVHGEDRNKSIILLHEALTKLRCIGITTNQEFLIKVLGHSVFHSGDYDTNFINEYKSDLVSENQIITHEEILSAVNFLCNKNLRTGLQSDSFVNSPWALSDGWRLNLPSRLTFHFLFGNDKIDVEVFDDDKESIVINGGLSHCSLDNISDDIEVFRSETNIYIADNYKQKRLIYVDPEIEFETAKVNSGGLSAPMPGKLTKLFARIGETVEEGETLLIIEAMKMEHSVISPNDGVVEDIFYTEGEQVEEGVDLLKLKVNNK
ncbi:MAG: Acetyl-/propionyl-coenzyme A carboxylase alpha chain [Alphaproteobacteria bacterium MarineAlpha12_Bin1]|nr:MAG: Acetyl-/propionyl-coenzyme A carboxylase alpha chain [Alphaproteobacteria bacterium MarineAlpha12_Bin1]